MPQIITELAESKEAKEDIFKFRYQVINKLGAIDEYGKYQEEKFEDEHDKYSWLVASFEKGKMTGTFRTYSLDKAHIEYSENCNLSKLQEELSPEDISYTSKFMIAGSKRKNRTILSLLKKHYELLKEKNIKADIICCPEPTLPYYEWIGYRKFGKAFQHGSSPWDLFPMVLLSEDHKYLSQINSPLIKAETKNKNKKKDIDLSNFFNKEELETTSFIQTRKLANLFKLDLHDLHLKPFLSSLIHRKYKKGETLFEKGQNGSSMYFIIKGKVKTDNKDLEEGDIMGVSRLLKPSQRNYTATALKDLETLELHSQDFYTILKSKPESLPSILHILGSHLQELI